MSGNHGFEVSDLHADHIAVGIAFMSKLAEREIRAVQRMDEDEVYKLRAVQHRFIKTHLQPLVE
ncbi:MAG: molecular chaperone TorD family protein [Archaeoglobaceae archaeon]